MNYDSSGFICSLLPPANNLKALDFLKISFTGYLFRYVSCRLLTFSISYSYAFFFSYSELPEITMLQYH